MAKRRKTYEASAGSKVVSLSLPVEVVEFIDRKATEANMDRSKWVAGHFVYLERESSRQKELEWDGKEAVKLMLAYGAVLAAPEDASDEELMRYVKRVCPKIEQRAARDGVLLEGGSYMPEERKRLVQGGGVPALGQGEVDAVSTAGDVLEAAAVEHRRPYGRSAKGRVIDGGSGVQENDTSSA